MWYILSAYINLLLIETRKCEIGNFQLTRPARDWFPSYLGNKGINRKILKVSHSSLGKHIKDKKIGIKYLYKTITGKVCVE